MNSQEYVKYAHAHLSFVFLLLDLNLSRFLIRLGYEQKKQCIKNNKLVHQFKIHNLDHEII